LKSDNETRSMRWQVQFRECLSRMPSLEIILHSLYLCRRRWIAGRLPDDAEDDRSQSGSQWRSQEWAQGFLAPWS